MAQAQRESLVDKDPAAGVLGDEARNRDLQDSLRDVGEENRIDEAQADRSSKNTDDAAGQDNDPGTGDRPVSPTFPEKMEDSDGDSSQPKEKLKEDLLRLHSIYDGDDEDVDAADRKQAKDKGPETEEE